MFPIVWAAVAAGFGIFVVVRMYKLRERKTPYPRLRDARYLGHGGGVRRAG